MTTTKAAPTPGPWSEGQDGNMRVYGPDNSGQDAGLIAIVFKGRANVSLIAEAGTVFHETGLSPRQLAARLAKAEQQAVATLRAIELAVDGLNTKGFPQKQETQKALDRIKHIARNFIASAEGGAK